MEPTGTSKSFIDSILMPPIGKQDAQSKFVMR